MDEELYQRIQNANNEEKISLIVEHISEFSDAELSNLAKNIDFLDLLKIVELTESEPIANSLEEMITKDGVNIVLNYKNELKNMDFLDGVISMFCTDAKSTVSALKSGIEAELLIESLYSHLSEYDLDSLSEEDRKLYIDNFYLYLPNEILERFDVEKGKTADAQRTDILTDKDNDLNKGQKNKMLGLVSDNNKIELFRQTKDREDLAWIEPKGYMGGIIERSNE